MPTTPLTSNGSHTSCGSEALVTTDVPRRVALAETVLSVMQDVYRTQSGSELGKLDDNAVLLQTGLDSLGFAIVVTRLEEELGYDPFSLSADAYYPTRFGEFVDFYLRNAPQ